MRLKCRLRRQPDAGKLPARLRRKEVAVAGADVPRRRDARSAAQNHLPAHELAVVLAQRAVQRTKARIAQVGAARPHPAIPVPLRGALVLDEICGGTGIKLPNPADFLRSAGPRRQPPTRTPWAAGGRPSARRRRPRRSSPGSPAHAAICSSGSSPRRVKTLHSPSLSVQ